MSEGQVAIITGAGRGIGRAIATAFAAAGWRVALVSRSEEQLETVAAEIRAAGGTAVPVAADVTTPEACHQMVAQVSGELGAPDLLLNNAGSFYAIGPVWEVDPERWWTDVTINLYGVFNGCHAVLPRMIERGRGRIINMIGGGTGSPFPYGSGYASSKAAVMRLTETLDQELRPHGIPVFAMGPGLVRTTLTEFQVESAEGRQWLPRIQDAFEHGRDVPPTRAAALALELASGRYDRLTGRCFGIGDDLPKILAEQDEIIKRDLKTLRFRGE